MENKIIIEKIIKYFNTNKLLPKHITNIEYKTIKEINKLFPSYRNANLSQQKGKLSLLGGKDSILYITIFGEDTPNWKAIWEKVQSIKQIL